MTIDHDKRLRIASKLTEAQNEVGWVAEQLTMGDADYHELSAELDERAGQVRQASDDIRDLEDVEQEEDEE